ncbi:MAG: amidohydrolase family protein, partial [Novosphingobium sp.]|nr:amidohydrolase family protein [Novosphingobium sp.]
MLAQRGFILHHKHEFSIENIIVKEKPMPSPSLIIRNALIADGTGAPAFPGDVAVRGDRISHIGKVEERAEIEIDAGGKVLAPGFIDVHTHYDPQLCWDKLATPTPEH